LIQHFTCHCLRLVLQTENQHLLTIAVPGGRPQNPSRSTRRFLQYQKYLRYVRILISTTRLGLESRVSTVARIRPMAVWAWTATGATSPSIPRLELCENPHGDLPITLNVARGARRASVAYIWGRQPDDRLCPPSLPVPVSFVVQER
jgi:hypothetical protein